MTNHNSFSLTQLSVRLLSYSVVNEHYRPSSFPLSRLTHVAKSPLEPFRGSRLLCGLIKSQSGDLLVACGGLKWTRTTDLSVISRVL